MHTFQSSLFHPTGVSRGARACQRGRPRSFRPNQRPSSAQPRAEWGCGEHDQHEDPFRACPWAVAMSGAENAHRGSRPEEWCQEHPAAGSVSIVVCGRAVPRNGPCRRLRGQWPLGDGRNDVLGSIVCGPRHPALSYGRTRSDRDVTRSEGTSSSTRDGFESASAARPRSGSLSLPDARGCSHWPPSMHCVK